MEAAGLERPVSAPRRRKGQGRRPAPPAPVEIHGIAAGGEGVGRLADGRVVFVHRTAPAERVEVQLVEQGKRWARGRRLRVLEASPDRREAPCPFYERGCGGCTLEHMHYDGQLRAKAQIVADALTRIGRMDVALPEVVASPSEFRYRNRVSFALRRLAHGRVTAGFHALGEPGRIVDIEAACLLPEEPVAKVWERLRREWGPDAQRLPSGDELRLTLRGTSSGAVSLLVEGGFSSGRPDELLEVVEGLASIWHRPGEAPAVLIAGAPGLPETWGEEVTEVGGTAFLQVNREAASRLEQHVLERVGDPTGMRIVDAYCGVGFHARRLVRAGADVVGIELDPQAVAEARRALPDTEILEGRVEDRLREALPADLVILNPPRAGLAGEVPEILLHEAPSRVIYVSCDPATLARDLSRMTPAFELEHLRCFDLFPQTSHVETVVSLRRRVEWDGFRTEDNR